MVIGPDNNGYDDMDPLDLDLDSLLEGWDWDGQGPPPVGSQTPAVGTAVPAGFETPVPRDMGLRDVSGGKREPIPGTNPLVIVTKLGKYYSGRGNYERDFDTADCSFRWTFCPTDLYNPINPGLFQDWEDSDWITKFSDPSQVKGVPDDFRLVGWLDRTQKNGEV